MRDRTPNESTNITRMGVVCLLLANVALLSGCYERVVSARGIGSEKYTVRNSYRSDTALDRAWDSMTGESKPEKRSIYETPTPAHGSSKGATLGPKSGS